MKTFSIMPHNIDRTQIGHIANLLRQGALIAYPTDTSYGIGCDILCRDAIARVRKLKSMHDDKPLSFVCGSLADAAQYAVIDNQSYRTIRHLSPGPFTFLLDATKKTPKAVQNPKRKRCGIRIPDNPICMALVEELGRPIISTTAKIDSQPCGDPWALYQEYENRLDALVDGGYLEAGQSTVLLFEQDRIEVVRQGLGVLDE